MATASNPRRCLTQLRKSSTAQRIRYPVTIGVQATKTFVKITRLMQEALAKVKGIVKGAIKIIAPMTYRQRYQRSSGRDPDAVRMVIAP